ncbi:MAG TPA: lipopolysaccharide biosynthesis protein [Pirellulales bacterium]|jgi:O-antigen/teichoic acid export membrane protein|nr:lipopolysaccharide biosynthesis protein [Pirellulales bacterium]
MSTLSTTLPDTQEAPSHEPLGRPAGMLVRLWSMFVARPDLRNGTLSLFDQAVVSGTGFLTGVIIGRLCTKEELGIYYLALSIFYLARGIQEQLICAPYVIYCQGRREDAQALYTGSSLLHFLGLSGVLVVALFGFLGILALGLGPASLAPAIWVLLGALPFLQLREFLRRLAIAHLQLTTAVVIDVAVSLLQLGGLLTLAYFHQLTVPRAYGVMGIACAIAGLGWFISKSQPLQLKWSTAVADWWGNWGFARWALASHIIGFATPSLMPYLVAAVHGSAEAGVLGACVNIVGTASTFMIGLASFLIPRAAQAFAQGGVPELRKVLRTATMVYACVLGAFAIIVLLSGDFLLVLAFGSKYSGYGSTIGVLSLGMMAQSLGLTAGIGLWAIDRPRANLSADICTLVVTLGVALCLLPGMGVLGAALGDLAGKVVGALIRELTLRRLLKTFPQAAEG